VGSGEYVDDVFLENGAPTTVYDCDQKETEDLKRTAAAVGAQFIPIRQRHIGTDNAPRLSRTWRMGLRRLA